MIVEFEKVGYKRGISLRGAPYDFRTAGKKGELEDNYQKLRDLIEDTVKINNGIATHLISHSLGGPYINLFLTDYVSKEWKEQFIMSSIMLSAPHLGTPVANVGLMTGPMYDFIP